jgi:hypothetical protein
VRTPPHLIIKKQIAKKRAPLYFYKKNQKKRSMVHLPNTVRSARMTFSNWTTLVSVLVGEVAHTEATIFFKKNCTFGLNGTEFDSLRDLVGLLGSHAKDLTVCEPDILTFRTDLFSNITLTCETNSHGKIHLLLIITDRHVPYVQ